MFLKPARRLYTSVHLSRPTCQLVRVLFYHNSRSAEYVLDRCAGVETS